jgi:hypothetical protein
MSHQRRRIRNSTKKTKLFSGVKKLAPPSTPPCKYRQKLYLQGKTMKESRVVAIMRCVI